MAELGRRGLLIPQRLEDGETCHVTCAATDGACVCVCVCACVCVYVCVVCVCACVCVCV